MDVTMKKGTRFDTYRAYLKKLRNRRNLVIYRYSHVVKVRCRFRTFEKELFYDKTLMQVHLDRRKQAYGITYVRHGLTKFVRADKEVILSAGSINTPQLLMLSGIGPKEHLKSLNVSHVSHKATEKNKRIN